MADEKIIIELGAEDNASGKLDNAASKVESMGSRLSASFKGAEASSKKFALALAGIGAAAVAMGVVSFNAYKEAEAAQKQLEHAVLDVSHATKEQLKQTEALSDALEKKGVLDGDNIKMGLAQLSTFGLSNKAVQGLGGSLADLAVNQFGVSASGEQLSDTANMIAKALNGQFGVLEKSGIRFTAAQQAIIKTGTEMEKVKAINEGFAQNLKYTNEVAMQTGEGLQAHLMVQLGNLQEAFGKIVSDAILPVISAFSSWLDSFGGADAVMAALIAKFQMIQPYWPLIAGAITGMLLPALGAMTLSLWATIQPLLIWGVAGAAVAAIAYLIYEAYQTNFLGFKNVVDTVFAAIMPILQQFLDFITLLSTEVPAFLELIRYAWETDMYGIQTIVTTVWGIISAAITFTIDTLKGAFKIFTGFITGDWKLMWSGIQDVAKAGGELLSKAWDGIMKGISAVASSVWDGIKNTFKTGINAIMGFVNGFIRTYNNAVGKVGAGGLKLPEFTPLAAGGIVTRPTFALIGEAGPEAVIPLSRGGASNVPGSGVTVVITGNNFYGDDEQFIQKIGDSIMHMLEPHLSYT